MNKRTYLVKQRSIVWGVFWGMTLFFLIWCVLVPLFILVVMWSFSAQRLTALQKANQSHPLLYEEAGTALVRPGYVGEFNCWVAQYRSDIDTFAALTMMEQDRMVNDIKENKRVHSFSGEAEVLEIDHRDHLTKLGPPALRVHYVQLRVREGERAGQTLWGLLTDLNNPTGSSN